MPAVVNISEIAFWFFITFGAALIGSRYKPDQWYSRLNKPGWTPPGKLFAPVWILLYILMSIAAWLIWNKYGKIAAFQLGLYFIQLILNAAWTWLFFGLHRIRLAFVDILLLWSAILATLVTFWDLEPLAGLLLVPYMVWVSFAVFLNAAILSLNS